MVHPVHMQRNGEKRIIPLIDISDKGDLKQNLRFLKNIQIISLYKVKFSLFEKRNGVKRVHFF